MEIAFQLPKILINYSLRDIADYLGRSYIGNDIRIDGFNLCNREIIADSVLSYCVSEKYLPIAISNTKVKALIVPKCLYESVDGLTKQRFSFIISENPEWTFYRAYIHAIDSGLYPSFEWVPNLESVKVGAGAIVEKGVLLGSNVTIGSNTVVKSGTVIGDNVHIGSCSVIGGEGFQLIKDEIGICHTIPHVGRTYIGSNVFIGDNTTVSCSLFEGYTMIGNNTKISSHVHIAHNCIVGENCVLTVGASLMGSAILRNNVWMAPYSCVMNRTIIAENTLVGTMSLAKEDTINNSVIAGIPAKRIR